MNWLDGLLYVGIVLCVLASPVVLLAFVVIGSRRRAEKDRDRPEWPR